MFIIIQSTHRNDANKGIQFTDFCVSFYAGLSFYIYYIFSLMYKAHDDYDYDDHPASYLFFAVSGNFAVSWILANAAS